MTPLCWVASYIVPPLRSSTTLLWSWSNRKPSLIPLTRNSAHSVSGCSFDSSCHTLHRRGDTTFSAPDSTLLPGPSATLSSSNSCLVKRYPAKAYHNHQLLPLHQAPSFPKTTCPTHPVCACVYLSTIPCPYFHRAR